MPFYKERENHSYKNMTKVVVNQVIEYYSQVKFKVKQIVLVRQIFIRAWVHFIRKKTG